MLANKAHAQNRLKAPFCVTMTVAIELQNMPLTHRHQDRNPTLQQVWFQVMDINGFQRSTENRTSA